MERVVLTKEMIGRYEAYLRGEEKSGATVAKYVRDVGMFYEFLSQEKMVDKEQVICFKEQLLERYRVSSANSMLVALNGLFSFLGWKGFCVRTFKCQRELVTDSDRELTKEEYLRLVRTAEQKGNQRLSLILQTICSTGIRIGELAFLTREGVAEGKIQVRLKGKCRMVILTKEIRKKLLKYCRQRRIGSGAVFVTRSGKRVDRSNVWLEMKRLSREAGVEEKKVFPHNLRHLFARTYYKKHRDIVYLADVLGHSSIDTTRIYTSVSRREHERVLSRLGLVI